MNISISDFKDDFDKVFLEEIKHLIDKAGQILSNHETKKYIEYIVAVASNGKRIRPYNTALTYSMYSGKKWHNIKNTLIGIELIHLMAIIQDDIMDNSETRHGVTSMHSYTRQDLVSKTSMDVADHTSRSIGVLLGDLCFAWAYENFSKDNQTTESWSVIHSLLEEVILGQIMDVYNPIESETTTEAIERKMLLKTARYTFTRPLLLGAVCAGKKEHEVEWIMNFGDSTGLLFQVQDDIFDITKDVTVLKKDPLGDMKNGTHTILSTYVVQHATEKEKELWFSWFGNKNTKNQGQIESFLVSTGALAYAEKYISNKENIALNSLANSEINLNNIESMKSLLSAVTKRKY